MKVFISWSGPLSQKVAEQLRIWLPSVIQSVQPYVSSEDTHKGSRWRDKVAQELDSSDYGILCVTPENISSQWLNFEAGALSKQFDRSYVSPFLIHLKATDLDGGPLGQFQATVYHQYDDVFKLVKSIDAASERQLDPTQLERAFRAWWRELKDPIDNLTKEYYAQNPVVATSRDAEDALAELLVLARGQQKILADLKNSRNNIPAGASPRIVRGIDFTEVGYYLRRLNSTASEAVIPGNPETPTMVQMRGMIGMLEKLLSPVLGKTTKD